MNKTNTSDNSVLSRLSLLFRNNSLFVFGSLWCILFVLYLPAAKGGWVSDTVESLQKIKYGTFWNYINIKESRGNSYQLTQLITYLFYQLFKTNPWPWHIVFLTLQAVNATMLFFFCIKLFDEAGIKNGFSLAAGGILLFCICPHISEVMVWKASYHYLQAMFMMLCILHWLQKFHVAPLSKYALYAGSLFLLSTFSDEFFLLTPFFVFTLIIYYHLVLGYSKTVFKRALLVFFLPLVIIVLVHLAIGYAAAGSYAANLGDEIHQPLTGYLRKPPLYLFHTVFFGRFFSHAIRQSVYDFVVTKRGILLIYGLLTCIWIYIFARFKHLTVSGKAAVLMFIWLLVCMALVSAVWFPEIMLVQFDRYAYFMLPFIYLLVLFFLAQLRFKKMAVLLFSLYALINIYCTLKVNNYWYHSARIVNHLLHGVPPVDNKIVLLLNTPEYMNGAPMIGPFLHFSFRQMYNLYNEVQINNTMYDVVSYNMASPADGVHINVVSDSILHVTLNQWGTWWWANLWGAHSYENNDYKFNLADPGHWYELTLKHPASQYLLLYQVGDKWKIADMNKKDQDQD